MHNMNYFLNKTEEKQIEQFWLPDYLLCVINIMQCKLLGQ